MHRIKHLTVLPHGHPRYLPRQGRPRSIVELVCQAAIRALACLPIYIAVVATLTFLVVVFGVPFVEGR